MLKIWNQCKAQLKQQLNLQIYSIWINQLQAKKTKNGIEIIAPNEATYNHVNNNLLKTIKKTIKNIDKNINVVLIQNTTTSKPKRYTTNLDANFSFENLVEGNANMFPIAVGREIAHNITKPTYNPFVIYGNSGLGKTHLMQAIGNLALKKHPKLKIIYMPLLNFVKNITMGIRHKNIEEVKNYYQSADLLLVDDIHLIADKTKSQEEFFHIFNFLFNTKKQIIFTCDKIPTYVKDMEERIKTRLAGGMSIEMKPPELEMRAAILIYKASKVRVILNEEQALYIANSIKSNVRALEGAILKLKAFVEFAKLGNTIIDKEIIDSALSDLIQPQKTNIDIFDIQKQTAKQFAITSSELTSNSRKQHLVLARQTAIYLSCELTNLPLTKIGQNFGNKNHSTILYSYNKFKKLLTTKEEVKQHYDKILYNLSTN